MSLVANRNVYAVKARRLDQLYITNHGDPKHSAVKVAGPPLFGRCWGRINAGNCTLPHGLFLRCLNKDQSRKLHSATGALSLVDVALLQVRTVVVHILCPESLEFGHRNLKPWLHVAIVVNDSSSAQKHSWQNLLTHLKQRFFRRLKKHHGFTLPL